MHKQFENKMKIADHLAGGSKRLKNTILKEALHVDILRILSDSALSRTLVFQGGTALRLCYGNTRYSEDLDFVRTDRLSLDDVSAFKTALTETLRQRYGLSVQLREPKQSLDERITLNKVAVHRWCVIIEMGDAATANQKINIEITDIPAYDARLRQVHGAHESYGSVPVTLHVSSEEEILADKIVAVVGRSHIKARDIWDIKWLKDKHVSPNMDLVRNKAHDYHLASDGNMQPFINRLSERVNDLALPETQNTFVAEMQRFLAKEDADIWLSDDTQSGMLLMDVSQFLERQVSALARVTKPTSKNKTDVKAKLKAWRNQKGINQKSPKQ